MKVARQIRSSDLGLILPSGSATPAAATRTTREGGYDADAADLLGVDDAKSLYSADVVDHNVALQSEVVEYEQLLETTGEVQVEGVRTQRSILAQRNAASLQCLKSFDSEYRCPQSSHFSKDRLIDFLELDVPVSALMKNLKTARKISKLKLAPGVPQVAPAPIGAQDSGALDAAPTLSTTPRGHAAETASSAVSSARSMASGVSQLPAEVGTSVVKVEELLAALHQKLASAEVQQLIRDEMTTVTQAFFGGNPGGPFGHALLQLNALAFTDVMQFIKVKVNSSNELFATAKANVGAAKEAFRAASANRLTDVGAYDAALTALVSTLEASMKVNADRLNQLMMNSDSEGNFRSTYESTSELIKSTIVDQRQSRTDLLRDIAHDSKKMTKEAHTRFTESERALGAYNAWQAQSYAKMEDCSQRQDTLWQQVEELVKQIAEVGKERAVLVKEHQLVTEKEYQRRRYYEEFVNVHKAHTAHLATLKELSEYTLKMLDHVELFYEHMTTAVEAKNFEEGLYEMKQADQKDFVELYSEFVARSADVLGHRSARKLLALRTARVSEFVLQSDPHCPEREAHKAVLSTNTALADSLTKECETVAQRVEKWNPLFDSVVEQLECRSDATDPREVCAALWECTIQEARDALLEAAGSEVASLDERISELEVARSASAKAEQAFRAARVGSPPRKKFVRESRARKNLTGRSSARSADLSNGTATGN